jgi:hypothetical protein
VRRLEAGMTKLAEQLSMTSREEDRLRGLLEGHGQRGCPLCEALRAELTALQDDRDRLQVKYLAACERVAVQARLLSERAETK